MSLLINNHRFNRPKWFSWFLLTCIIILFALGLSSCSCEYYATKLQKKCGKSLLNDTIVDKDTLLVKSVERDTVFKYFQRDTVIVREGRLTMKYFYNRNDSTVYLNGKCDTVKIIQTEKIPYEKIIITTDWFSKYKWWIIVGFCALLIISVLFKR